MVIITVISMNHSYFLNYFVDQILIMAKLFVFVVKFIGAFEFIYYFLFFFFGLSIFLFFSIEELIAKVNSSNVM